MTSIGAHVSDRYRADSGELEERFPGVINPGSWGEVVIDAPKYFPAALDGYGGLCYHVRRFRTWCSKTL